MLSPQPQLTSRIFPDGRSPNCSETSCQTHYLPPNGFQIQLCVVNTKSVVCRTREPAEHKWHFNIEINNGGGREGAMEAECILFVARAYSLKTSQSFKA